MVGKEAPLSNDAARGLPGGAPPSRKAPKPFFNKRKYHLRIFLACFVFNELNMINSNGGFTLPSCSYTQFAHHLYVIYIIYIFTLCAHE